MSFVLAGAVALGCALFSACSRGRSEGTAIIVGAANSAINLTLGASALPSIFVTPPVAVPMAAGGPSAYALAFDVDRLSLGDASGAED